MHCRTLPRIGLLYQPVVVPLWTYVASGPCFTGLVLNFLFSSSYYALIKATLSLHLPPPLLSSILAVDLSPPHGASGQNLCLRSQFAGAPDLPRKSRTPTGTSPVFATTAAILIQNWRRPLAPSSTQNSTACAIQHRPPAHASTQNSAVRCAGGYPRSKSACWRF